MFKKSLVAVLALAVALAFSPMLPVNAAPLLGSKTLASESVVELAAKKKAVKKKAKKAKKGKKKGKKAKKSKAGKCGAFMYYSKGKCADARNKK